MDKSQVTIRSIIQSDNVTIATIIRKTLKEFGADLPGTVYYDDTTDDLFNLFKMPRSAYFIATVENEIVGGAGIFPSAGLEEDTCELVKMYLTTTARGKGIASSLIGKCIEKAKKFGFKIPRVFARIKDCTIYVCGERMEILATCIRQYRT
jgi:putative acetyltransferase